MCKEVLVVELLKKVVKGITLEEFLVQTGLEVSEDTILYIDGLVEFVEEFSGNSLLIDKLDDIAGQLHRSLSLVA